MSTMFNTLNDNYIVFNNEKIGVVVDNDNMVWFNAKNIADILGYKDSKLTINMLIKMTKHR
jgi:prophage antirepressor-like protein